MHAFLGASQELSKEDILPKHFNDASHVHLIGYLAYNNGVLEKSLKLAQEKGATVSLDLSSVEVISGRGINT